MPGKDGTGPDGNGPKQQSQGTPGQGDQGQRGRGRGNRGQFCPWRDPRSDEPKAKPEVESDAEAVDGGAEPAAGAD